MTDQERIDNLIKSILARCSDIILERECKNINLNQVGSNGRSPLQIAAFKGSLKIVKTLVQNGASVHYREPYNITALHEAAGNGHTAVVKYLLSVGADINAETKDKVTPLMCAAAWGYLEAVKCLLENGADRTKTDIRGGTAADIAREKGENDAADLIDSFF